MNENRSRGIAQTRGLASFLASAVLFKEAPSVSQDLFPEHGDRALSGSRMPLPDASDVPVSSLGGEVVMSNAVQFVTGNSDKEAFNVLKRTALVQQFNSLKRAINNVRASELGGVPIFVVPDDPEDVIALFDQTVNPENGQSIGPLVGHQAEMALAEIEGNPYVHLEADEKSLWERLMGVFGFTVEEATKAAALTPAGGTTPPGQVDFKLNTNTPNILVDFHEPYRRTSVPRQFGMTGPSNVARRKITEGVYRFSTQDLNAPNGLFETPSIHCFRSNPQGWTRAF